MSGPSKKESRALVRVLVVDDEPAIAELLQAFLQAAGLQPEVLTSSARAAERLAKEKFDVVFLDVNMPQPDGIELARRMRAGGYNQSTTLVMLTGASDLALQRKSFEAGANIFLFKPIDRQRLLRVVRSTQASVLQEKRRFQRIPVACKVSLATQKEKVEGTTVDISLGGLQARAPRALPARTAVAIYLQVGGGAPVKATGQVVRVMDDQTMGIQIREISPTESERLQEFLLPHVLKALDEPEKK